VQRYENPSESQAKTTASIIEVELSVIETLQNSSKPLIFVEKQIERYESFID
jgi:hypothetical protein